MIRLINNKTKDAPFLFRPTGDTDKTGDWLEKYLSFWGLGLANLPYLFSVRIG